MVKLLTEEQRTKYINAFESSSSSLKDNSEVRKVYEALIKLRGAGSFASHVDIQASLNTILDLKKGNKLTKSTGSAADIELAAIHRYTENGGVLNTPMRNGSEVIIGPVPVNDIE